MDYITIINLCLSQPYQWTPVVIISENIEMEEMIVKGISICLIRNKIVFATPVGYSPVFKCLLYGCSVGY